MSGLLGGGDVGPFELSDADDVNDNVRARALRATRTTVANHTVVTPHVAPDPLSVAYRAIPAFRKDDQ